MFYVEDKFCLVDEFSISTKDIQERVGFMKVRSFGDKNQDLSFLNENHLSGWFHTFLQHNLPVWQTNSTQGIGEDQRLEAELPTCAVEAVSRFEANYADFFL